MKNYSLKINGNQYEVAINDINEASTEAHVTVNGSAYDVEILGGKVRKIQKPQVVPAPADVDLKVTPKAEMKPVATPSASASAYKVTCPLPGTVTELKVKVGDTVAPGQTLIVLEAMKMSNNIDAEKGGVVKQINTQTGATVMEGDLLMVIE